MQRQQRQSELGPTNQGPSSSSRHDAKLLSLHLAATKLLPKTVLSMVHNAERTNNSTFTKLNWHRSHAAQECPILRETSPMPLAPWATIGAHGRGSCCSSQQRSHENRIWRGNGSGENASNRTSMCHSPCLERIADGLSMCQCSNFKKEHAFTHLPWAAKHVFRTPALGRYTCVSHICLRTQNMCSHICLGPQNMCFAHLSWAATHVLHTPALSRNTCVHTPVLAAKHVFIHLPWATKHVFHTPVLGRKTCVSHTCLGPQHMCFTHMP